MYNNVYKNTVCNTCIKIIIQDVILQCMRYIQCMYVILHNLLASNCTKSHTVEPLLRGLNKGVSLIEVIITKIEHFASHDWEKCLINEGVVHGK